MFVSNIHDIQHTTFWQFKIYYFENDEYVISKSCCRSLEMRGRGIHYHISIKRNFLLLRKIGTDMAISLILRHYYLLFRRVWCWDPTSLKLQLIVPPVPSKKYVTLLILYFQLILGYSQWVLAQSHRCLLSVHFWQVGSFAIRILDM